MCVCVCVCACVCACVYVPRSGAERHISSGITMKRHAAYLDDKQHGRDLSATLQIRRKDSGKSENKRAGELRGEVASMQNERELMRTGRKGI